MQMSFPAGEAKYYERAAFPARDRDRAVEVADSLSRRYDCPVEIEPFTFAELEEPWT